MVATSSSCTWPHASPVLCLITLVSQWLLNYAPVSGHFERLTLLCVRGQLSPILTVSPREASMGQVPSVHTYAFMHHSLLAAFPLSRSALGILQSLTSPINWLTPESFVHYLVWNPSLGVLRSEAVSTSSARVVPDMHTLCPITSKGNRKLSSNNGHKSK